MLVLCFRNARPEKDRKGSLVVLLLAERARSECARSTRAIEDRLGYPVDLTDSNRREDNDDAYAFLNHSLAGCDFNERWHLMLVRIRCHDKSLTGSNQLKATGPRQNLKACYTDNNSEIRSLCGLV